MSCVESHKQLWRGKSTGAYGQLRSVKSSKAPSVCPQELKQILARDGRQACRQLPSLVYSVCQGGVQFGCEAHLAQIGLVHCSKGSRVMLRRTKFML